MNRFFRLSSVFSLIILCANAPLSWAQESMQSNISSLQRFMPNQTLGETSDFDIRDVFIGEPVLAEVKYLILQGGKVHYIAGGNRSDRVKISFFQPYQQTQLEQVLQLNFDKNNGFINSIDLTYSLESRYVDIQPVYEKVLNQAIKKYGKPLTYQQVSDLARPRGDNIRLSDFIQNIQTDTDERAKILNYFTKKQVTPRTHFADDGDGNAILKSGFRQCYFWHKEKFVEILSMCSFQSNSGNMRGQGITLSLENFSVQTQILNFKSAIDEGIEIQL